MASVRAPNHPVNVTGLFETLDEVFSISLQAFSRHYPDCFPSQSVPDGNRANQYGNVNTPSCISCAGFGGSTPEDFELNLTTNTALNNVLQSGSTYFLAGRLLAPNNGSTPTLTYQHNSAVRNGPAGPTAPDFTNKVNVIGLGLVISRQEVVTAGEDAQSHLEVILQHSDWDSLARAHRSFTVRYLVPGTKIFIKTHSLYLVGRELEITGNLVDFDMEQYTAVISVNSVAVTTGHQLGRGNLVANNSPSGSKSGKKFNKFSPSKPNPTTPQMNPNKKNFSHPSPELESPAGSPNPLLKGKGKANTPDPDPVSDDYDSDLPIASASNSTNSKARVRPDILKDAAKRLKK
ncbi:hypothetical protein MJO28_001004 [Puccinia striiformis f. sp. tritici]|uniref:Uncharacterized protein n=1 Tax=Puccinia striiformis f. sp. tritici TaxID=168172 RepID=A0ACC0EZ26_9BASI|nr:hypothetical protein MJO28_001004 [Puccinia striiformis f. sp. tritici]